MSAVNCLIAGKIDYCEDKGDKEAKPLNACTRLDKVSKGVKS